MDRLYENLPTNSLAVDLLGQRLLDKRQIAIQNLTAANLSPQTIIDLGIMMGLPTSCQSIDMLAEGTERLLFNPVSGLMYEDRARITLLQEIGEQVISGDKELVVMETDINGLKGLNEIYGDKEANKAIKAFAQGIKSGLTEAIEVEGREIGFALVNMWGGRSDSIKLVLIGADISTFTREFIDKQCDRAIPVVLKRASDGTPQEENVSGEWGFSVVTRDDIEKEKASQKEKGDLDRAGDLYSSASSRASDKMAGEKVWKESELIKKILKTDDYNVLLGLLDEIERYGARIPQSILEEFNNRRKTLTLK